MPCQTEMSPKSDSIHGRTHEYRSIVHFNTMSRPSSQVILDFAGREPVGNTDCNKRIVCGVLTMAHDGAFVGFDYWREVIISCGLQTAKGNYFTSKTSCETFLGLELGERLASVRAK